MDVTIPDRASTSTIISCRYVYYYYYTDITFWISTSITSNVFAPSLSIPHGNCCLQPCISIVSSMDSGCRSWNSQCRLQTPEVVCCRYVYYYYYTDVTSWISTSITSNVFAPSLSIPHGSCCLQPCISIVSSTGFGCRSWHVEGTLRVFVVAAVLSEFIYFSWISISITSNVFALSLSIPHGSCCLQPCISIASSTASGCRSWHVQCRLQTPEVVCCRYVQQNSVKERPIENRCAVISISHILGRISEGIQAFRWETHMQTANPEKLRHNCRSHLFHSAVLS